MSRTRLSCVYRLGPDEVIQVAISIPNSWPDCVAEAKATVLTMMHDELADVMRQTRGVSPAE